MYSTGLLKILQENSCSNQLNIKQIIFIHYDIVFNTLITPTFNHRVQIEQTN